MSKQANLFPLYIQRTAPAEWNHFSGLPKQVERANMQGIRAREAGQQSAGYNPGWVWHQERTHEKGRERPEDRGQGRSTHPARRLN